MNTQRLLTAIIENLSRKGIEVTLLCSEKHGIEVGELKNNRITINVSSRDKMSLVFTIAHLFGHFVQFQNYAEYKDIVETVERPVPLILSNEFKQIFWEYEKEAFGIGMSLMLESFYVSDEIDHKYQTFMNTDFEHYWNYLITGEKGDIMEFNKLLKINYAKNIEYKEPMKAITIPKQFSTKQLVERDVTVY